MQRANPSDASKKTEGFNGIANGRVILVSRAGPFHRKRSPFPFRAGKMRQTFFAPQMGRTSPSSYGCHLSFQERLFLAPLKGELDLTKSKTEGLNGVATGRDAFVS